MEISISSFSLFDLSLARRRLQDARAQGLLASPEADLAIALLDEMIAVIENGIPTELQPAEQARPSS